jgi:hypothetical protein
MSAALSRLPPEVRQTFETMTPVGWVPIDTMERVFTEIAVELRTSVRELHVRVAEVSIERTFRTFWRMLLKVTTDRALVSLTPVIFAKSYNRGRLVAEVPEPGRGEIELLDWPDAPEWPIRATRIGIETVLRVAGRTDARVQAERTPTGAKYAATWA